MIDEYWRLVRDLRNLLNMKVVIYKAFCTVAYEWGT